MDCSVFVNTYHPSSVPSHMVLLSESWIQLPTVIGSGLLLTGSGLGVTDSDVGSGRSAGGGIFPSSSTEIEID